MHLSRYLTREPKRGEAVHRVGQGQTSLVERRPRLRFGRLATLVMVLVCSAGLASAQLNENCTVAILNQTAHVQPDGSWQIDNVPADMGAVRARATCVEDGTTRSGQSGFVGLIPDVVNGFEPNIVLGVVEPIPASLSVTPSMATLTSTGATIQLIVSANFPQAPPQDVTSSNAGTTYSTSNARIATVNAGGLVTPVTSGTVLITAFNEGALGFARFQVVLSGDSDGDGIPDDVEVANGLDPNNPVDALEDPDRDGLTNREELDLGTDPRLADSDGDTISDGEEVIGGADGFVTNPLLADTDGDGIRDALEIATGSDPTDPSSFNLAGALSELQVAPSAFEIVFNTLLGGGARQLTVTGVLRDATTIDLTSTSKGTNYNSSDLSICSFGAPAGRVFAGTAGTCMVTASNAGFSGVATVTVRSFAPTALSFVSIPGLANNVDVDGDLAYVAAGAAGLQVVDVANRLSPAIIGFIDTPGSANDVRIVGTLAYIADGSAGLQIIDVTTPSSPALVGSVDTPGDAQDVVIAGGRAYVADGSQGLQVIDVSDPASPRIVGAVDTPGTAFGVDVNATRGLAVVADGTSGVRTVSIADPAQPIIVGTVATHDARDVVLAGDFAFIADFADSFTSIDVADPANPELRGSTPQAQGGRLRDVTVFAPFAFGADVLFVNAVPIFDVDIPESPGQRGFIDFSGFRDDDGTGIAADESFVYLTAATITGSSRLYIGQYVDLEDEEGIPPAVRIVSPVAGAVVTESSTLHVAAEATDDIQVIEVRFFLDGEPVFVDRTAPYEVDVVVPRGLTELTLGAAAVDRGGNIGVAADVTVDVVNDPPPMVDITSPSEGATLIEGSTILIAAEASDNVSVASVVFRVNGVAQPEQTTPPFELSFTVPFGRDSLDIAVTATDNLGGTSNASRSLNVIPDPGTTAVGVVVNVAGAPLEGATVTCLGRSAATQADGTFAVEGVPSIGTVQCTAIFVTAERLILSGESASVSAVPGGDSDVGTIVARASGPLYPRAKLPVPFDPSFVVAVDLNEDGVPDIATSGSTRLSFLIGRGDGTFQEASQRIFAAPGPGAFATGDFNKDGMIDIAATRSPNQVLVLLGTGDTSFPTQQLFSVGDQPSSLVVADFDGDGNQDIATSNRQSGDVSILLGSGDGTFQDHTRFVVGDFPDSMTVLDANMDGLPDLAATNFLLNRVAVLIGRPGGNFDAPRFLSVGNRPRAIATADINLDQIPDLVTVNGLSMDASVLLGRGDGTFQTQRLTARIQDIWGLALGDVNRDTFPDIVTANANDDDVSVLLGNGDGTFGAERRFPVGNFDLTVALADMDLDGNLDILTANSTSDDVSVLLGLGDGNFEAVWQALEAGDGTRSVEIADTNGDAIADIIAANANSDDVSVFVGIGDGRFAPRMDFDAGGQPMSLATADVNRDGAVDLITANFVSDDISVLLGRGDGTFLADDRIPTGDGPVGLGVSDLNQDGIPDLITVNQGSGDVSTFLGVGDGTFGTEQRQPVACTNLQALAVGDFVGLDGNPDVVVGGLGSTLCVLQGRGDGRFFVLPTLVSAAAVQGTAIGDVDGDGTPDIVSVGGFNEVSGGPERSRVSIFLGNGNGTFQPRGDVVVGTGPRAVVIADVNVDGVVDLVTANGRHLGSDQNNDVSVFLGRGDGTFDPEQRFAAGDDSSDVAVGDLNRDGLPDLVTANPLDESVTNYVVFSPVDISILLHR